MIEASPRNGGIGVHQWKVVQGRMSDDDAKQYADFLAWKASQPKLPEDETPPVSIAEVLYALINSAQFHTESQAQSYRKAVADHFGDKDDETVKATDV